MGIKEENATTTRAEIIPIGNLMVAETSVRGRAPQGTEMTGTNRTTTAGIIMDTAQTEADKLITKNPKIMRVI